MRTANKTSGIKGVTITKSKSGKEYWRCRIQGRLNISKLFPFTEKGKERAAIFYKKTIELNRDRYYNYELSKNK